MLRVSTISRQRTVRPTWQRRRLDVSLATHAPDGKYLWLLHPRAIPDVAGIHAANSGTLITPNALDAEKLVDLRNHDYRLEPNASFAPDGKWLIFRSGMWGARHVYAAEIKKQPLSR